MRVCQEDSRPVTAMEFCTVWVVITLTFVTHKGADAQYLNVSDIRLVGGKGPFEGLVEISINGVWGTICDDWFDAYDADVMCKMMGLRITNYFGGARYGQGRGPIFAQRLACSATATHLNDCTYTVNIWCTHARDIGIMCTACGTTSASVGTFYSILDDAKTITTRCSPGYEPAMINNTCNGTTWSSAGITCTVPLAPFLNVSGIRLVNGSGPYEGRVEVYFRGEWGTICDESFDITDADVMCKMMNLSATGFLVGGKFGQGTGPVHAQALSCSSTFRHLRECQYSVSQCSHARDVGIICSECGQIIAVRGKPSGISADGNNLTIACLGDSNPPLMYSICQNRMWSPPLIRCNLFDANEIRLVGGQGLYDGRVELLVNGVWGTVCGYYYFTPGSAAVFCKMLGYGAGVRTYMTTYHYYGAGNGQSFVSYVQCSGNENDIDECTYDVSGCSSYYDVAVACNVVSMNISGIRLSDGTGPYDGRVELLVDGKWGTVCNRDGQISDLDAGTLCRMQNLNLTSFLKTSVFGTGPLLLDDIYCSLVKDHIDNCSYVSTYRTYCNHNHDLSLICTPCGLPPNYANGDGTKTFNGSQYTVKCQKGSASDSVSLPCLSNGTWDQTQQCTPSYAFPPFIKDIRLASGYYPTGGRVEILINETWGTICGNNFEEADARVICRMLNLTLVSFYSSATRDYGPGTGPVYANNLNCTGNETHINNCTYDLMSFCTHQNDVAVICTGYQLNITDVRLAGSPGPYHGRVEIKVGGVWGTICQNDFEWNACAIICRMLGLELRTYYYNAHFGQGSGPIYIDRLRCISNNNINQCQYVVNNYFNCTHAQDVSVACQGPKLNITEIRLVNGKGQYDGRVEIKVGGTWGTICDVGFDIYAADRICQMMGLRAFRVHSGAFYGNGSGPVHIDQMLCPSYFSNSLSDCPYLYLNTCNHQQDVSVVCNGPTLNITQARLVNGSGPYDGRVEVRVGQTWGTVCDAGFDLQAAEKICQMFGLRAYKVLGGAYYGEGSGPIHIDQIFCAAYHSKLSDCPYVFLNSCNHQRDVSIVCYGPRLNVTEARLANKTGTNDGRAEIKVNGTWGTICDQDFDLVDAEQFCKMLNLSFRAAKYFTGAYHGKGSGPVYIERLFCRNTDAKLSDCQYVFQNSCTHERDVSVICNECGPPSNTVWGVDFINYDGIEPLADCNFYRTYIGFLKMTCQKTGQWVTEGECREYSYPLKIQDIRLAGGDNATSGRVEIKSLDTWGTVCDHYFGKEDADVLCNMLGYPPSVEYKTGAHYGQGSGPIFVDDLNCNSGALHINNCTYETYDNCRHSNDISVTCTDCGSPAPRNGFANSTNTSLHSIVKIWCDNGYKLIGDEVITCQINRKWTSYPSCKLIDCGDPTPKGGSTNTTQTTNGTVAGISCDVGYTLVGASVIVCQPSEKWSSKPTCSIKDCGSLKQLNANVELPTNKTTYGEQAVITCNIGYRPGGSTSVSCQANGTWEKWPECEVIDCKNPTPFKGLRNNTDTKYGAVVMITCESGYNLTGKSVIECRADGSWSDLPICDASDCGGIILPNGNVDSTNGTTTGSVAKVSCNTGYDLIGSTSVECTSSGWNNKPSCKIQDCGDPTSTHGRRTNSGGTTFGAIAKLECDIGYALKGDSVITCQDGGKWSDKPPCIITDCGKINNPDNCLVNTSGGTVYNSQMRFTCKVGYLLVGEKTIACKSDGEWTAKPPHCVLMSSIGENCTSEEFCLFKGARCINSICKCVTGINDPRTQTCDAMPLLPYGTEVKDKTVSETSACGQTVTFNPGIPLYDKQYTRLFVCANGYVSFRNEFENPTPPRNRNEVTQAFSGKAIIAPFYAEMDSNNSGPVFYRSYDILNTYLEMKRDSKMIKYIEDIIRILGNITEFRTSFILIATWTERKSARVEFDMTKSSTFQAVIISDGKTTFLLNIYGHGLMGWQTIDNLSTVHAPVFIGYALDTDNTFSHPYAFSTKALQLDVTQSSAVTSKKDVSGLVFHAMTSADNQHLNHAVDCIEWYNNNEVDKQRIDNIVRLMPECPCDIRLSQFDPWYWEIGLQRNIKDNVTYKCVDMLHAGNFGNYGKSCCYDMRTWSWVQDQPYAGGFELYHPRYPVDHYRNDVLAKDNCCIYSDYCDLYYKVRPTGKCYQTSPYNFGRFWGDPHFRTLDGLNFTFNGLGEFTLLRFRSENGTFDLQARTERAVKQNGNLSDATLFSAFAAKDYSGASFHAELNKAKTGLNVFANKVDITTEYNSVQDPGVLFKYMTPENNLIITKRDGAMIVLFPMSQISLNITVSVGMLSLSAIVPQSLQSTKGILSGLLGNYDGNPNNDFTMPNGTRLPFNISEGVAFSYGMTWEIDSDNSAFVYEKGKNHTFFHNKTYVPRFLDEADPVVVKEAETFCNGTENIECVFDYVFTENTEVASSSGNIKDQSNVDRQNIETTVPMLKGCNSPTVTSGSTVECYITYDAANTVEFIVNNANATFNSHTSTLSYTQLTSDPIDIQLVSRNEQGWSSSVFHMTVVMCTGCSGHGRCTDEIRDDPRANVYFKYATCKCDPQHQGIDCEEVFDGCAANPCSHGRNCTKLSVEDQISINRSYVCSSCPVGYLDDNIKCIDVDECRTRNFSCEQVCVNTDGSFVCLCKGGFRPDPKDWRKCRDINECDEAGHNCSQICNNTVGGFQCGCYAGYTFNATTWSCVQNGDVKCNTSSQDKCKNTDGCAVDDKGKPFCFCNEGFELTSDGTSCIDVNECIRNVCPQNCNNTLGSFKCHCFTGYKLTGRSTCEECKIPNWGDNCDQICDCNGRGAERCDPVNGCLCKNGWQGPTCNDDIDECSVHSCDDPRRECINTQGSFTCSCRKGFQELENRTCGDIDECSKPITNNCSQTCLNSLGGYTCGCFAGYTKENATHCKDIDECSLGTHKCQQQCVNNPGTYSCFCHFGYTLNDDRHSCEKQQDPCLTTRNLTCEHYCLVEQTSASCKCYDGYVLGSNGQACYDVNECSLATLNYCGSESTCVNINGSYLCKCPTGSKLENDGRTCTECDEFHFGINCSSNCSCLYGKCEKTTGCRCDSGWAGDRCDKDINECDIGLLICDGAKTLCVNTPGSAVCLCRMGFVNNSGSCEDINECIDPNKNNCDQICVNKEGGYRCDCQQGFRINDLGKCEDINECVGIHGCSQICENTVGSYRCLCEDGFRLNLTDRKSCLAENQCSDAEVALCGNNTSCSRAGSGPICACRKGFQNATGLCKDTDECSNKPQACSQICSNTVGSFFCSCYPGFYLGEDKSSCRECEQWSYGDKCGKSCSCNLTNTEKCDKVTGQCYCKSGWKGFQCSTDVNECTNTSIPVCPANSYCENRDGGFLCKCNDGFFKSANGLCEECDDRHFGTNCFKQCTCNVLNTQDCDNVNGACSCKKGWQGDKCNMDIDECAYGSDICKVKPESFCENLPGSYLCECNKGYHNTGDTCADIDECARNLHVCPQLCINTGGSFTCACEPGFRSSNNGKSCTECSDNTFGPNCQQGCICDSRNTLSFQQTCNKVTGACICKTAWQGDLCDEDVNECEHVGACNASTNTVCANEVGSYRCECEKGYNKSSEGICTTDFTTSEKHFTTNQKLDWAVIIGASAGGLILIIVVVVLCVWCVRRQRGTMKEEQPLKRLRRYPMDENSERSDMQAGCDKASEKADNTGVLTWRSKLTNLTASSHSDNNDDQPPYKIPRARAKQFGKQNDYVFN